MSFGDPHSIMTNSFTLRFLICLIVSTQLLFGDYESLGGDDIDMDALKHETLFVGLGSYCLPASLFRSNGLRKAAFPLDWNISLDGEGLIEMLRDQFQNF